MLLGAGAAIISVMIFQQGMWALLHVLAIPELTMPPPYPTDPVPPFGVPRIFSLCFWGGLWGAVFGLVWRGPKSSYWFGGFWLGVATVLVTFFVVLPLKGLPAGGGSFLNWLRALLINCSWGLGVGGLLTNLLGDEAPPEDAYTRYR